MGIQNEKNSFLLSFYFVIFDLIYWLQLRIKNKESN
jgi:hypothetical protein